MMTPWNVGVADGHLSGLEKFESPDPAEWIPRGYAIISADTREQFVRGGIWQGRQEWREHSVKK